MGSKYPPVPVRLVWVDRGRSQPWFHVSAGDQRFSPEPAKAAA